MFFATWSPCFNPLHCGAVVASIKGKEVRYYEPICFNPLHCGAVVASGRPGRAGRRRRRVSIPFIAGQWSLLTSRDKPCHPSNIFQSPSLRGSGRFLWLFFLFCVWRFLSIPFIAGQWSLLDRPPPHGGGARSFQSPSLRGSGRFARRRARPGDPGNFQSPSLRGSGRFPPKGGGRSVCVSTFNPLHCGAVVASPNRIERQQRPLHFQSPSLRGSGRFDSLKTPSPKDDFCFQSPSLRGSGRFDRAYI